MVWWWETTEISKCGNNMIRFSKNYENGKRYIMETLNTRKLSGCKNLWQLINGRDEIQTQSIWHDTPVFLPWNSVYNVGYVRNFIFHWLQWHTIISYVSKKICCQLNSDMPSIICTLISEVLKCSKRWKNDSW